MAAGRRRSWIAIGGATAAVAIGVFGAVALATPSGLSAPSFTHIAPHLTWSDTDTPPSYTVQRSGPACTGFADVGSPTPDKFFDDTTLQPGGPDDGPYCYQVAGGTETASVLYDTTAPGIQITNPVNASLVSGVVQIGATATDAGSNVDTIALSVAGPGQAITYPVAHASPGSASLNASGAWDTSVLATDGASYVVTAVATDRAGNTATVTATATVDNTAPAAPSVSAVQNPVAGKPTLVWTPKAGETYSVYRDGALLDGTAMPPWNEPTELAPGTYDYGVIAKDSVGNPSPAGHASVVVIPPSVTAPRSLSATSPTNAIPHLTWQQPVTFAVLNWLIYRDGALIATIGAATTSFDDAGVGAQGPHTYAVQATNGSVVGDMSSSVSVIYDTTRPTLDPASATANPNGSISLSWPDASDPPPGSGISSYVVRRGSGTSAPPDASSGAAVCTLTPPANACTDSSAKSGTTYGYAVFAIDAAGNLARREASAKAADTLPPDAVAGLKVVSFDRTYARLGWTVPALKGTDSDLAGYKVLRLRPGTKAPLNPQDGTVVCRNDDPKDNICDALNLTTGKRVWFAVYAHDEVPNYSAPMVVSIVPRSVDRKAPHKPTKVKLARDGLNYTLTWVSPRDRDLSKFRVTLYNKKPAPRPSKGKAIVTGRVLHATFTLKPGKRVYVNLFALDVVGNFSRVSKLIVTPQIVAKSKHKTTQQQPAKKKPVKKKPARKKAVPEKPVSVTIQKA
jgi:hypothetical protein